MYIFNLITHISNINKQKLLINQFLYLINYA